MKKEDLKPLYPMNKITKVIINESESLHIKEISKDTYAIILIMTCFRQPIGQLIRSKETNQFIFNNGETFLKNTHLKIISKFLDKLNI
jgi:hypothetical protein